MNMSAYSLQCELLVKRSLSETFAFFENPANLAAITPPWLSFQIKTQQPSMRQGAEFDYIIKWLGFPMKWRSLISKYDPPHCFVDEQIVGPYKSWHHRHTFAETENGIIVGDHLEYTLPLGPLGSLAQTLMVKRQVQQIFCFRQKALAKIFAGSTEELLRPTITTVA